MIVLRVLAAIARAISWCRANADELWIPVDILLAIAFLALIAGGIWAVLFFVEMSRWMYPPHPVTPFAY